MKDVQCYELFGGIALKNHAFSFFHFTFHIVRSIKNNFAGLPDFNSSEHSIFDANVSVIAICANDTYRKTEEARTSNYRKTEEARTSNLLILNIRTKGYER